MELDSFCHLMPMKNTVLTLKKKKEKIILEAQDFTHWYMAPGADAYLMFSGDKN